MIGGTVVLRPWVLVLIAFGAYGFVSYRIWHKEWLRAERGKTFGEKRPELIREWVALNELHGSKNLQDPMSPEWGMGEWTRPYKLGVLQGKTTCLWDAKDLLAVRSIPELIEILKNLD